MPVLRYLTVGLANTAVGLGVVVLAQDFLNISPLASNALGYSVAIPMGFALNRRWTFRHAGPTRTALYRYVTVLALAYFANLGALAIATLTLKLAVHTGQLAGVLAYTATSYLGMRHFAFRRIPPA